MAYFARYMLDEHGNMRKVVINAGVGFCLPFYGETAPPGTLACDGSEISRTVYDELFAVLGTKAGAGDGSTTFNLPDLRGMFVRGTGGNAAELGVEQGDAIRNMTGSFAIHGASPAGTGIGAFQDNAQGICFGTINQSRYLAPAGGSSAVAWGAMNIDVSRAVPTAAENRPVNVALLWCIIYE